MKKLKILTVFGVLLAMGITACNKGGESGAGDVESQEAPVSQPAGESGAGTSSEHKHSWSSWTQTKAPTCTEKGKKERTCACGEKDEQDVPALGHDFENGTVVANTDTSTCTADGEQQVKCSRCDATTKVAVKAHHKFGAETDVAKTGTDDIAYKTAVCSVDSALKISFPTEVGGVYSGTTRKNGTPEGYTKLTGSGSISWKLNLSGTKGYIGKMYHMACMDAFSSNSEKNYGYYTTSGSSTRAEGNFKFYVNGIEADKSAYMNISFGDLTKDGETDPALDAITSSPGPYSPVALCPLGDNVYIGPGENVFKYERTGSYNMVMRELVFIGTEYTHEHNNSTDTWAKDENQHWNACTNPGCPTNGKVNAANHTFQEVAPADDTETDAAHKARAATCSQEGIKVEVCSVCQYRKESPIAKTAHTFPTDGGWTVNTPASCTAVGERQHECEVCHEIVKEVIAKLDHQFGDAVENYAAVTEGENQHIAATAHNCSVCNLSAVRWAATAYDVTKSTERSTAVPESRDSGNAIRFSSTPNFSGGDATVKGCHIVYNVNVPADATNVGLAVYSTKRNDINTVFAKNEGDSSKGYEYVNGELVRPDSRYGLKVDGQVIILNADNQGWKSDSKAWYEFPVVIPSLTAGVHEIEIYNLGGYRADFYEFELTGLPHVTPSHVHNGDATWLNDENDHWHVCTGEGCPLPSGGIYDKAAHTWSEPYDQVAATCSAKGSYKVKCTVCQFEKTVPTDKLEHAWTEGPVTVDGTKGTQTLTCSSCGETKTVVGGVYDTFKWSDALQNATALDSGKFVSGSTYEFVIFNVPAAGTYTLTLNLKGSNGNGSRVLNGSGQGFEVKANGVAATFLGDGKTYAEFFGDNQTVWVDVAFMEAELQAGKNTISIKATTGYYRISANASGDMSLAPKA